MLHSAKIYIMSNNYLLRTSELQITNITSAIATRTSEIYMQIRLLRLKGLQMLNNPF